VADTKISALTALTGVNVTTSTDVLAIVDTSATATKRITVEELRIALGGEINSQSANYTTVLADAGRPILHPTADNNPRTFTIDSNANVAYPLGTLLPFVNQINTLTIALTTDTLTLQPDGTTGSITLTANQSAVAKKVSTTGWAIIKKGAVATATVAGLVPVPPNNTTTFLRGDATFAAPGGGVSAASQAEMEAASSTTVYASPGTTQYHPGVAKAWVQCGVTGNIKVSHNITSITDTGAGQVTVTIATDFSSNDYAIVVGGAVINGDGDDAYQQGYVSQLAGSFIGITKNATGTREDPNGEAEYNFACFGDQ
jgi:hypothetical protein